MMSFAFLAISNLMLFYFGIRLFCQVNVKFFLYLALAYYGFILQINYFNFDINSNYNIEYSSLVYALGSVILIFINEYLLKPSCYKIKLNIVRWRHIFNYYSDRHVNYSFIFLIISISLILIFSNNYNYNWQSSRQELNIFVNLAALLLLIGAPGVVSSIKLNYLIFIFFIMILLVELVLIGSRAAILTAFAFYIFRLSAVSSKNKSKILYFFYLLVILLVVNFFHGMMRGLRALSLSNLITAVTTGEFQTIFSAITSSLSDLDVGGSEGQIYNYFLFSIEVSDENFYGFLTSLKRVLLIFIPKAFYIDKPVDVTYLLWKDAIERGLFYNDPYFPELIKNYDMGVFGSLHPTLFGELFLSGGWLGLLIGLIGFSLLFTLMEYIISKLSPIISLLIIGPTSVGILFIARGNSVIGFSFFFYTLVIIIFLLPIIKFLHYTIQKLTGSPGTS